MCGCLLGRLLSLLLASDLLHNLLSTRRLWHLLLLLLLMGLLRLLELLNLWLLHLRLLHLWLLHLALRHLLLLLQVVLRQLVLLLHLRLHSCHWRLLLLDLHGSLLLHLWIGEVVKIAVVLSGDLAYLPDQICVGALQVLALKSKFLVLFSQLILDGLASATGAATLALCAWLASLREILNSLLLLAYAVHTGLLECGGISVNAAQVLVQVLLSGEALSSMALAVLVWTVQLLAWASVLVVHFALVAQQSTAVCKAWELLASFGWAFIWAIVLIHVFPAGGKVSFCTTMQHTKGRWHGKTYDHSHFLPKSFTGSLQCGQSQKKRPFASLVIGLSGFGTGLDLPGLSGSCVPSLVPSS